MFGFSIPSLVCLHICGAAIHIEQVTPALGTEVRTNYVGNDFSVAQEHMRVLTSNGTTRIGTLPGWLRAPCVLFVALLTSITDRVAYMARLFSPSKNTSINKNIMRVLYMRLGHFEVRRQTFSKGNPLNKRMEWME